MNRMGPEGWGHVRKCWDDVAASGQARGHRRVHAAGGCPPVGLAGPCLDHELGDDAVEAAALVA